jgi:hypothetical protein
MESRRRATGGKADVYVLRHGDEYLVRPAFVIVDGKSTTFTIRNLTWSSNVVVTLDPALAPSGNQKTLGLRGCESFDILPKPGDTYIPYQVTVDGQPAYGESDPVIIIDPPAT